MISDDDVELSHLGLAAPTTAAPAKGLSGAVLENPIGKIARCETVDEHVGSKTLASNAVAGGVDVHLLIIYPDHDEIARPLAATRAPVPALTLNSLASDEPLAPYRLALTLLSWRLQSRSRADQVTTKLPCASMPTEGLSWSLVVLV